MTAEDEPPSQMVVNMLLGKSRGQLLMAPAEWRIRVKVKTTLSLEASSGDSKVQCYKEQCCTETWSIGTVIQGKSDVVKQEIARMAIDVLGIRELK